MRKIVKLAAAAAALPLALAGVARAADPSGPGIVLYDAFGHPVAILCPVAAPQARPMPAPAMPDPMLAMIRDMAAVMQADVPPPDFFAHQDAMMRQAMQAMLGAADAPPSVGMPGSGMPGMVEAALGGAPGTASQVMVRSFSSGAGSCSETISTVYPGNGGAPQVAIRRVGDACGSAVPPSVQGIPAAQPAAPSGMVPMPAPGQAAPTAPDGSRLIRVDYRHPARPAHRLHG